MHTLDRTIYAQQKNERLALINSLGDKDTRQAYRQALIDYLLPFEAELSEDSKRRLHENPLRVLDSKDKRDQKFVADAPSILDLDRTIYAQQKNERLALYLLVEASHDVPLCHKNHTFLLKRYPSYHLHV